MAFRFIAFLMLAIALASCSSAPASRGSANYMQAQDSYAFSNVPDMEQNRKINEQECTKAIDLVAGNLRCR